MRRRNILASAVAVAFGHFVAPLQEEALTHSLVFASRDYAEMKAARKEGRDPRYRGR